VKAVTAKAGTIGMEVTEVLGMEGGAALSGSQVRRQSHPIAAATTAAAATAAASEAMGVKGQEVETGAGYQADPMSGCKAFQRRAIQCTLVVGLLFHLKISTLLLNAVYCVGGVLNAEKSITCYEGRHLPAAILAWLLLVFYAVLFPVLCFLNLKRLLSDGLVRASPDNLDHPQSKGKVLDDRHLQTMGFLYSNVKPQYYYYNCFQFVTNGCIAITTVFLFDAKVQLFSLAIIKFISITYIYVFAPLTIDRDNTIRFGMGILFNVKTLALLIIATIFTQPAIRAELPLWSTICTHTYTHKHTHTRARACVSTHVHKQTDTHTHSYTKIHRLTYACTLVCMYSCSHTSTHKQRKQHKKHKQHTLKHRTHTHSHTAHTGWGFLPRCPRTQS
jgi:hypothetical protein